MKNLAAASVLAATALMIGACSVTAEKVSEDETVSAPVNDQAEASASVSESLGIDPICFNGCNRVSCKDPRVKAACIAACPDNLIKNCKKA